jgi:hypothetical protein
MHHVARFSGATLMRPAPSLSRHRMALTASSGRTWEDVLEELSSLITFKTRADGKGWRDAFENMPVYLQASVTAAPPVSQRASRYCPACFGQQRRRRQSNGSGILLVNLRFTEHSAFSILSLRQSWRVHALGVCIVRASVHVTAPDCGCMLCACSAWA